MNRTMKPVSAIKESKLDATGRVPRRRYAVVSQEAKAHPVSNDEIEIARRRMQHLRYRNVVPLPMMHFVAGRNDPNLTAAQRAAYLQIGLQVLAVQMWQATTISALR